MAELNGGWQPAVNGLLERTQAELTQALAGELRPYSCQMVQAERGQTDAHAANRLRLALALHGGPLLLLPFLCLSRCARFPGRTCII